MSNGKCRWCVDGPPEWSYDSLVWIHRRERLDRRCLNPPNDSGKLRIISESVKPPAHPFYGDSWERGLDPWHVDAAPTEFRESSVWQRGERKGGWFLLDNYKQEIGFVYDGTSYPDPVNPENAGR